MATTKNGVIIVDVLQASTLVLLVLCGVFVVVTHLWTRVYLESESFYLARSRLYQNTNSCSPNTTLVPDTWVSRQYFCNEASVKVEYKFLPKLLDTNSSLKTNDQFKIGLCESKVGFEK